MRILGGYLVLSHMWGKKLTVLRIHRMGGRWTRHKVVSIAQAGLKIANVEAAQL